MECIVVSEISVPINSDLDIFAARQKGRALVNELGFTPVEATLFATTISELGRDILFHANSGEITLKPLQQEQRVGIMVRAAYEDKPTILRTASVAAQRDFTSSWSRLVLQRVRFVVDEMDFDSRSGEGATMTAIKWLHEPMRCRVERSGS
jgi:serine/threonine-protein kinase RsbT